MLTLPSSFPFPSSFCHYSCSLHTDTKCYFVVCDDFFFINPHSLFLHPSPVWPAGICGVTSTPISPLVNPEELGSAPQPNPIISHPASTLTFPSSSSQIHVKVKHLDKSFLRLKGWDGPRLVPPGAAFTPSPLHSITFPPPPKPSYKFSLLSKTPKGGWGHSLESLSSQSFSVCSSPLHANCSNCIKDGWWKEG